MSYKTIKKYISITCCLVILTWFILTTSNYNIEDVYTLMIYVIVIAVILIFVINSILKYKENRSYLKNLINENKEVRTYSKNLAYENKKSWLKKTIIKQKILLVLFTSMFILVSIKFSVTFYNIKMIKDAAENVAEDIAEEAILVPETWSGKPEDDGYYHDFDKYKFCGNDFYFEHEKYSEDEIRKVYRNVLDIMTYLSLEDLQFDRDVDLSFYLAADNYINGEKGEIFLNDAQVNSTEEIVALIKGMYGEKINEGAARALAEEISKNVFKEDYIATNDISEIKSFLESDDESTGILDLNLPAFEEIYYTAEENDFARDLVHYVYNDYLSSHEIEDLMNLVKISEKIDLSFEDEYQILVNEWLQENDINKEYEAGLKAVRFEKRFAADNNIHPYMVYTDKLQIMIPKDFNSIVEKGYFDKDALLFYQSLSEYDFVKYISIRCERNAEAVWNYFDSYTDKEIEPVLLTFCDYRTQSEFTGIYSSTNNEIFLYKNTWCFAHEYTHYVTFSLYDSSYNCWNEGIAEYMNNYELAKYDYSLIYDAIDENVEWSKEMNEILENNNSFDEEINLDELTSLITNLSPGRNNNLISDNFYIIETFLCEFYIDTPTILDQYSFSIGQDLEEQEGINLTYPSSAYFTKYLIENYGLEKFIELYDNPEKFEEIYDCDFDTMHAIVVNDLKETVFTALNKN